LELARQRQSAKEQEVPSPSVLQSQLAPPAAAKQTPPKRSKSAGVQKRIENSCGHHDDDGPACSRISEIQARSRPALIEKRHGKNIAVARPDNGARALGVTKWTTRTKVVRTPTLPIRIPLPLIAPTVKSFALKLMGSEMTEDLVTLRIRPNVRAVEFKREQQTARHEAHLDDANPITEEIQVQVQPPEPDGRRGRAARSQSKQFHRRKPHLSSETALPELETTTSEVESSNSSDTALLS
jgi:hypothetical protein